MINHSPRLVCNRSTPCSKLPDVSNPQMMAFNEQVVSKGAFAIEAPITGGLEALKKGQMTVLMAGDKDKVKEVIQ